MARCRIAIQIPETDGDDWATARLGIGMPEPEWISPEEALRRYGKALDEDEPGKKGKAPKSKRISPSGRSIASSRHPAKSFHCI